MKEFKQYEKDNLIVENSAGDVYIDGTPVDDWSDRYPGALAMQVMRYRDNGYKVLNTNLPEEITTPDEYLMPDKGKLEIDETRLKKL